MQYIHHMVRKVLPFLYQRNWYNGQFEFVPERALLFVCAVGGLMLVVGFALWLGQPLEYTQAR